MALGEASAHPNYYSNIMQHSKNDQTNLISVNKINRDHSAEKSPSMLYAMQSIFREKMAMKINQENKNSRTKKKSIEHENSLLELCEKRQNMVKKYSENCKENNFKAVASGSTNRMKKLPPITTQNNENLNKVYNGITATKKDLTMKKPFSKSSADFSDNVESGLLSKNSATHRSVFSNQKTSNDLIVHKQERKPEESPPDVSKLRIVRNKRKHELLKLNTKHASSKNLPNEEQPLNGFYKNQTKRNKEKQISVTEYGGKNLAPAVFQQPATGFQKWQAEYDKESEQRLARHRNATKQRLFNQQPQESTNYLRRKTDFHDVKTHSSQPTHKNEKKRNCFQPSSTSVQNHSDDDFPVHLPNHDDIYSKSVTNLSDQRGAVLNRKTRDSPLTYNNQVMPGLHKPVLVRHDGRSNNSSRTSTRNTFHSQTKIMPPMEGERDVSEKFSVSDSTWNKEKGRVLVDYETAVSVNYYWI